MPSTTKRKTDMNPIGDIVEDEDEVDYEEDILPIVRDFDKLCFEYGDRDAILLYHDEEEEDDEKEAAPSQSTAISYFEIQEYSKLVAAQLYHRFGQPDYILLEVSVGSVVCDAVATLACMRLQRPFVPVSVLEYHRPGTGRLEAVVQLLTTHGTHYPSSSSDGLRSTQDVNAVIVPSIVAIVVCANDRDPILSAFYQAGIHRILYLDAVTGCLLEGLSVPDTLHRSISNSSSSSNDNLNTSTSTADTTDAINTTNDDMYIMFTSGTTNRNRNNTTVPTGKAAIETPSSLVVAPVTTGPKAVIGSHRATYTRLTWFLTTFPSSPRIGRRTKLTFVDGVNELWGGLLDPHSVLVALSPARFQAHGVAGFLVDHTTACTQLLLLPSQAQQLVVLVTTAAAAVAAAAHSAVTLERIILSGEVCSPRLFQQLRTCFPTVQILNLYGQTETTGDVLYAILTDTIPTPPTTSTFNTEITTTTTTDSDAAIVDNIVAVGKPITANVKISLSLSNEDDTNTGEPQQQLVITGTQLSNGYLGGGGTAAATARARSVATTLAEFPTGDVGFYSHGNWYVRGRINDVQKIHGILTSPVEIEAAVYQSYSSANADEADMLVVAVILENASYALCTSPTVVTQFSRLYMHQVVGIPLHLIPTRLFGVTHIPRSTSGANKIDRTTCAEWIKKKLLVVQSTDHNETTTTNDGTTVTAAVDPTTGGSSVKRLGDPRIQFFTLLSAVLRINKCDLDEYKSFLELGGDSASAITLLYHLKQDGSTAISSSNVTATEILWSKNIIKLERLVTTGVAKRTKIGDELDPAATTAAAAGALQSKPFVPTEVIWVTNWHRSISFSACVDSTPVVRGTSVIVVCQGGVIMKFNSMDGRVEGYRHYPRWKFQADVVLLSEPCDDNLLLVCGYSSLDTGIMICLTCDLQKEVWKSELKDSIKSSPIVLRNGVVWVLSGHRLVSLDVQSGKVLEKTLELPRSPCVSNPVLIRGENAREDVIAFASSDWEGGMILVNVRKMEVKIYADGEFGPVYKNITASKNLQAIFVSDIYGSVHALTSNGTKVRSSIHLSSNPLTSVIIIDTNTIIVGSYNGILFCVRFDDETYLLEEKWKCDCFSSIYSTPLKYQDESIIVCTTAGFVLKILIETGSIQSFHRIPAEIWSSPVQIGPHGRIAVGARDSRCHIVSI